MKTQLSVLYGPKEVEFALENEITAVEYFENQLFLRFVSEMLRISRTSFLELPEALKKDIWRSRAQNKAFELNREQILAEMVGEHFKGSLHLKKGIGGF